MVDEQKLRQLAEAATPGPWEHEDDTGDEDGHNVMAGGFYVAECFDHAGGLGVPSNTAGKNAEFIAALNPATILSLLDELQTLREERTAWRVTAENAEAAVKQARIDALEEAKQAVSAEEILEVEDSADDTYNCGVLDCVRAIEKLKEAP